MKTEVSTQADETELDSQPSGAGHALGPGQPVGTRLQLAGDERRAPEHADDRRDGVHDEDARPVHRAEPAGDPDPGPGKHDEVVADPLDVGDQVRGEHDADPVPGHGFHEALQELAAGQRVQAGDRLVEQEQVGMLGQSHGQGELDPLPTGQRPGSLPEIQAKPFDPAPGLLPVPLRVEPRAGSQVVSDRQPGVHRRVLGDEPDPGHLARPVRGPSAEHADRAGRRREEPDGQVQQRGLARPVRAYEPDHPASRDGQVQSRSAQRRPYLLPRPAASRMAVTRPPRRGSRVARSGRSPRCRPVRARPSGPSAASQSWPPGTVPWWPGRCRAACR
jgi:hypothetical protein